MGSPVPILGVAVAVVQLGKLVKDPLHVLRLDADAGIANRSLNAAIHRGTGRDRHAAGLREFDGVGDEIGEDAPEFHAIGV